MLKDGKKGLKAQEKSIFPKLVDNIGKEMKDSFHASKFRNPCNLRIRERLC
jgi:hypothetical protein